MVNKFPKVQEGRLCGETGDGKQQLWPVNMQILITILYGYVCIL